MDQPKSLIARSAPLVVAPPTGWAREESAIQSGAVVVDTLALCRDSVALFAAHSGPVLACALIGYAGVSVIAQSFGLLTAVPSASNRWPYLFFAACGALLHALAQGAIAWIGLQVRDVGEGRHVGRPLRIALSRWQMLLAGSLVHALLTFMCAVGCTALLVRSGLGLPDQGSSYPNPDGMPRLVALRSIDTVLLGPLHPLSELITPARYIWLQHTSPPDVSASPTTAASLKLWAYRLNVPENSAALDPSGALPNWLVALISIVFLILTETLLRFRAVAAMCETRSPGKRGILTPLVESARLGLHYFWLVTASTWGLRLAVNAIQITCFLLPVAIADNVILPQLSWITHAPWISLVSHLVCYAGGALLGAILTAFCDLYDARLFSTLQHAGSSNHPFARAISLTPDN